jgi:hypothetical protein
MSDWFKNIVEANSSDAYYKCFDAATPTDRDPDTSYEKWYGPLEEQIAQVLLHAEIPKSAFSFFDDWCKNNTRHVDIESQYVNAAIIAAIHDLIKGESWRNRWRIEVTFVGTIKADDWQGKLGIWSEWVLCWGIGKDFLPK